MENSFYALEIGSQNADARAIYTTLIMNIEKMSKIFGFFLTRCSVIGFVPLSVLRTLVNYFVYDFGTESYFLATPMWYEPVDMTNRLD